MRILVDILYKNIIIKKFCYIKLLLLFKLYIQYYVFKIHKRYICTALFSDIL